jgi:hypothetical protein
LTWVNLEWRGAEQHRTQGGVLKGSKRFAKAVCAEPWMPGAPNMRADFSACRPVSLGGAAITPVSVVLTVT